MSEERTLEGGNTGGAVLVDGTVRRQAGPWTTSVHAVLAHLEARGFVGAPRPRGFDDQGREVLTYLPGEVVGAHRPWPAWTHSDEALVQVAHWLRTLHLILADFEPPADAVWREGGTWRRGLIIGHNDAAPYNAVWQDGRLVGFFDWDFAAPAAPEWDLAFTAFAWVPLHARHVAAAEGFTAFDDRLRRLRLFLASYADASPSQAAMNQPGSDQAFVEVVQERVRASIAGIRRSAAAGDPAYQAMITNGVERSLMVAIEEMPGVLRIAE